MLNSLTNAIKAQAVSLDQSAGQIKFGTVTSVNNQTSTARVMLQPSNILTGWLPVFSQWVGNGWGMVCPLTPGDQVLLVPQDDDIEQSVIVGRCFSNNQRPPTAPPGEFWLFHQSGSFLKLCNDGTVRIKGDLHVDGDIYDRVSSLSSVRTHYDGHTHRVAPNSTTSTPSLVD